MKERLKTEETYNIDLMNDTLKEFEREKERLIESISDKGIRELADWLQSWSNRIRQTEEAYMRYKDRVNLLQYVIRTGKEN